MKNKYPGNAKHYTVSYTFAKGNFLGNGVTTVVATSEADAIVSLQSRLRSVGGCTVKSIKKKVHQGS